MKSSPAPASIVTLDCSWAVEIESRPSPPLRKTLEAKLSRMSLPAPPKILEPVASEPLQTESSPSPASMEAFAPLLSIVSLSPSALIETLSPLLRIESARAVPVRSVALVVLLILSAESSSVVPSSTEPLT